MRIAIANNFHPFSGIGKYAFNLQRELLRQKKDSTLLYCQTPHHTVSEIPPHTEIISQKHPYPLMNQTLSQYYYFPPRIPEGFDVYHASSHYLARMARYRKPTLITHMDLAPRLFPNEYPFHMKFFYEKLLHYYKQAHTILTISPRAREELRTHNLVPEEKIISAPPGVDTKIYKPRSQKKAREHFNLPLNAPIILNVGSEEARKNTPFLLETVATLQKTHPQTLLVRAGPTDSRWQAHKQKIKVREFSKLPEEEMALLYNAADAFVFPATYEGGFAYPPLEAMASGLPTLVLEELALFQKGALVLPESKEKFISALERILGEKSFAQKLKQRAIRGAGEFTLEKHAKQMGKIFEAASRR